MDNKSVVLLSGGLDSTVLLHNLKDRGCGGKVLCLAVDYGQLHKKEIECATWQAEKAGAYFHRVDLRSAYEGIKTPMLGHGEIPEGTYAEQQRANDGRVSTYVPNRNMVLLSVAAAHAMDFGADTVYYAAHMDDACGGAYPDCTPEFVAAMDAVLKTQGIRLNAPFVFTGWNKQQIVRRGIELHVDFSRTWSCYVGDDRPCGKCGTCRDRIAAFEANGMKDPLSYSGETMSYV